MNEKYLYMAAGALLLPLAMFLILLTAAILVSTSWGVPIAALLALGGIGARIGYAAWEDTLG